MKVSACIATHAAALVLGLLAGRSVLSSDQGPGDVEIAAKKVGHRQSAKGVEDVFASLEAKDREARDRYRRLKETLPVASDHEKAVREARERLPAFYTSTGDSFDFTWLGVYGVERYSQIPGEEGERIAEFEVRVLHWLRDDPEACLKFLGSSDYGIYLTARPLRQTVFVDYAEELGWEKGLTWIADRHNHNGIRAFLQRQAQEGFTVEKLDQLVRMNLRGIQHPSLVYADLAKKLPFDDRGKVLDAFLEGTQGGKVNGYVLSSFLSNEDNDPEAVLAWVQELRDSDRITEERREEFERGIAFWLKAATDLPMEQREEVLASLEEGEDPVPFARLTTGVTTLLDEGRDWRFELRHGRASVEDIWNDLRARLPDPSPAGQRQARTELYYELAQVDPAAARDVLAPLSPEDQAVIYAGIDWRSYRVDPDVLYQQLRSLPATDEASETERSVEAWGVWTATYFARGGQGYIDWVADLPPGLERRIATGRLLNVVESRYPDQLKAVREQLEPEP